MTRAYNHLSRKFTWSSCFLSIFTFHIKHTPLHRSFTKGKWLNLPKVINMDSIHRKGILALTLGGRSGNDYKSVNTKLGDHCFDHEKLCQLDKKVMAFSLMQTSPWCCVPTNLLVNVCFAQTNYCTYCKYVSVQCICGEETGYITHTGTQHGTQTLPFIFTSRAKLSETSVKAYAKRSTTGHTAREQHYYRDNS